MRGGRRIALVNYAEQKKVYEDRTRAALAACTVFGTDTPLRGPYARDDLLGKRRLVTQRRADSIAE